MLVHDHAFFLIFMPSFQHVWPLIWASLRVAHFGLSPSYHVVACLFHFACCCMLCMFAYLGCMPIAYCMLACSCCMLLHAWVVCMLACMLRLHCIVCAFPCLLIKHDRGWGPLCVLCISFDIELHTWLLWPSGFGMCEWWSEGRELHTFES